jgi:hypothetical protein
MKSQVCIIINHPNEIDYVKKKVLQNYSNVYLYNYYAFKKSGFKDFFTEKNNIKKYSKIPEYFCKNWFLNYQRNDLHKNKIIGWVLYARLLNKFTETLKIYIYLKKLKKKFQYFYVSEKLYENFQNVANCLKINLIVFKSNITLPEFLSASCNKSRSTYSLLPQIHKLSFIARLLQYFITYFIRNKKVLIAEQFYLHKFKNYKNFLYLNKINLLKGFYYKIQNKYKIEANEFFEINLVEKIFEKKNLETFSKNFNKKDCYEIEKIFFNDLLNVYNNGRKFFIWSYVIYKDLLNYYRPTSIIVSGCINFNYIILNYLAKKDNIKTKVTLDGYPLISRSSEFLFDNKRFIYDYIYFYGRANKKLFINNKINDEQITKGGTILLKKKNYENYDCDYKYDFIVMTFSPFTDCITSRWDFQTQAVFDVIKVLHELKYKKILIKIKPSNLKSELAQKNYFLSKIKHHNIMIDISTKPFQDVIHYSKNIVGGLSTAVYEAVYFKKNYFVYHPRQMGLHELNNFSVVLNKKNIAKNLKDLKKNILNKKTSTINNRNFILN